MFIKTKGYSVYLTNEHIYPTLYTEPGGITNLSGGDYFDKAFCEKKFIVFSKIVFSTLDNKPEIVDWYKDEWILYYLSREKHYILFILSRPQDELFEKKIVDATNVNMDYTDSVIIYPQKPNSGNYIQLINSNSYISANISNIPLEQRFVVSRYKYLYGILSAKEDLKKLVKNNIYKDSDKIVINNKSYIFDKPLWT